MDTLTNIAIGISTIKTIFVIEIDCCCQGIIWTLHPLQNLLCPIHSQEAMHFTLSHQLYLLMAVIEFECRTPKLFKKKNRINKSHILS